MLITVLDNAKTFSNEESSLDKILEYILKSIEESNMIFSHLEIDGKEIYSDIENYLFSNYMKIQNIKIVLNTPKELYNEVILSTIDYIYRAMPEIEKLSNEFYKAPSKESWRKLIQLLEGLNWILVSFSSIDSKNNIQELLNSYETWNLYAKKIYDLKDLISELDEAITNNDLISIADILSYELTPIFTDLREILIKLK